MEINNIHKVDLSRLENVKPRSDILLKNEKDLKKIMILKPEEIREIIKKLEELYRKLEEAASVVDVNHHAGGGHGGRW